MERTLGSRAWHGLAELEADLREFLARRCRDTSEVDDVLQETYLRAARNRHALEQPDRLRGWAMRIAANVLRDIQRRNARLPHADLGEAGLERLLGVEPGPPDAVADEEGVRVGGSWVPRSTALRELAQAVCELRPPDRLVLQSFYGGGQCGERTARECGLPRALVKVRLFRARRRLEGMLRQRLVSAPERVAMESAR